MKNYLRMALLGPVLAVWPLQLAAAPFTIHVEPQERTLHGSGASQRLLLIARYPDGSERDVTEQAKWQLSDASLASLRPDATVEAKRNGLLTVTADVEGQQARATLRIEDIEASRPFQFGLDIGNLLTRQGCNSPACHGGVKGRGGFKLSSGALHPKEDWEWIVKGGAYQVLTAEVGGTRVPRVDVKNARESLLLKKATATVPHGGGRRFAVDSADYKTILQWVESGAQYGAENLQESQVTRLEIYPRNITMEAGGQQRLLITAHLAGGRTEDFSAQALCTANDKDIAKVSSGCIVKAGRLGETAVLVRAAGLAASASVGIIGPPLSSAAAAELSALGAKNSSNVIDGFVLEKLRRFRVPPSGASTDAEFLRRVSLDLAGTLPPPERVREFLQSRDPNKRTKLVDTLMASPEFVDYWTFRFDDVFRVAVAANGISNKWSQMYANWVRESIASNKPYDQMARERIAAQGYDGPTRHYLPYDVIGPIAETMAEEVRVFFGRRLDCAQCHNHPYESWTQDQFWGMAAFFSRMFKMGDTGFEYVIFDHPAKEAMGNGDVNGSIKAFHPRTKAELRPVLLDGTQVRASDRENPRKALAEWMVRQPYFAEAAVNRMWSNFFGRGLVDPVDDFRSTNPATHPELLERLATDFREHGHDLRHLIRTIVTSRTYQLSGRPTELNRADRTNYSHAWPRALDAEVLLDAITSVTGIPETFTAGVPGNGPKPAQAPTGTRAITLRQPDLFYSRFLEIYGRPNRLTLPERNGKANLAEALHMLAGSVYQDKLAAPDGRLQRLVKQGRSDRQIIEEFYLAAYTRLPQPAELEQISKLVAASPDRSRALQDFVWAVLASREFSENH